MWLSHLLQMPKTLYQCPITFSQPLPLSYLSCSACFISLITGFFCVLSGEEGAHSQDSGTTPDSCAQISFLAVLRGPSLVPGSSLSSLHARQGPCSSHSLSLSSRPVIRLTKTLGPCNGTRFITSNVASKTLCFSLLSAINILEC